MTTIDWVIVGLYIAIAIGIGAWFTKRASQGTSDFFVAGRSLGWFVAGTSIVATTFAADTPVFVAGMSRIEGISANWFWWSVLIGQVATATIFAKLWRRSEVLTDVEFVQFRYGSGMYTTILRLFKSLFNGVFFNCVVMAAVTLAMVKVTTVLLDLNPDNWYSVLGLFEINSTWLVLLTLGAVGLVYSALSGLYGVVYTDMVQFVLAMVGSIGLAVIAYLDASSGEGLMAKLQASPDFNGELLQFFPRFNELSWPLFIFVVYIMMLWWSSAPGKGYSVQRLLATNSERDAKLAFLWYAFLHYVIRPWPWIVVGILSLIYFPGIEDSETAFPLMIDHFLPAGLKGVMVAAMLAAFMSTIDTHLNWGASYVVNDVYEPYINPNAPQKHYVLIARATMVVIMVLAIIATTLIPSILDAFKFIGVFFAGLGTVLIARWFWWRVNAKTEIVALASTIIIATLTLKFLPNTTVDGVTKDLFTLRVLITTMSVAAIWITFAIFDSKLPTEADVAFHEKMQIGGKGWNKVSAVQSKLPEGIVEWILVMAILLCILLGTGKVIFHEWGVGLALLAVAVVLMVPFIRSLKRA
ncbi:MAG: Na+:solute symporter [Phycisphaerales bacterium]|nr:Na+:solute symporter [Phycisphaerales bacterium]